MGKGVLFDPPAGVTGCKICGCHQSPQWRKGDEAVNNFCNACGIDWARKGKKSRSTSFKRSSDPTKKTKKRKEEDSYPNVYPKDSRDTLEALIDSTSSDLDGFDGSEVVGEGHLENEWADFLFQVSTSRPIDA